ncbi:MAG TPA: hypothetical protein PLU16_13545 [Gallionellaceae bacterium]|nr:MAG: hypothetical protein B7Y04_11130 [Gallionellales bacterium 24-53-125]HQS59321.1 hypothetical protein [Gallionellaceae bacterium]HQS76234.1 hypothetical protein [Gallionellaceae bacterium]
MKKIKVPSTQRVFLTLLAFAWFISDDAIAQPLEDIYLQTGAERVIATIKLSSPVHNVRYLPPKQGMTLEILLDKLPSGSGSEEWLDNEVRKSPPSSLIPSFTVKTNLKSIQPKLIVDFSREAEYTVHAGRDGRSILIAIKIDKVLPVTTGGLPNLPEVKPLPANASDINKQASALMQQARNALAASDNAAAIDAFNKLLLLPPNDYTQDGQESVGVARERAGQTAKAKLEYELYLKLYDSGSGVERVRTRLARLGTSGALPSVTAERQALKKQKKQRLTYGSLSMHYYHGASKIDSVAVANSFSSVPTESTFSAVDQSALLTTLIATERFISEEYDNRLVFQDTAYTNFIAGKSGKNRLGAAFFEVKNRLSDYSARIGRQSSSGGGVMGRFDGALAGFGVTPSLRVNAVAGQLSDYTEGSKPVFYGLSMDMGPVTLYAINQTVDGVSDRRAIGSELRFFEPTKSAFILLDYDTSYSTLNTATFQGNLSAGTERTYSLLLDHRKAPYISTRNALNGASTTSVNDLLSIMNESDLRTLAAARTGTSDMAQLGMTQQLSQKWQLGGDIKVSRYAGLPASGTTTLEGQLAETPGTGNELAISPQLIGSNLFSQSDVTIFSVSYSTSALAKGQSFYVYSRAKPKEKWSLDASLQYYRQNYLSGTLMTRIMPMVRTSYQMRQTLSLDFEAGIELSRTESAELSSDSQRQFFSLGFRWDF